MENTGIKVSVVMITYNHADYILEAIEGVLNQRVNFNIELIIADDNSPDSSQSIVLEFLENHPQRNVVKYTKHKENKGTYKNFVWALAQASGSYIALCEGDDYWDNENKLQHQVNYLDINKTCTMMFNRVSILNSNLGTNELSVDPENQFFSCDDMVMKSGGHTLSFIFRNGIMDYSVLNDTRIFGADLIVALDMASKGKVYGSSEIVGVYRKHDGGVSSVVNNKNIGKHLARFIKQFIFIREKYTCISDEIITLKISDACFTTAKWYGYKNPFKCIYYIISGIYFRPVVIKKVLIKLINGTK